MLTFCLVSAFFFLSEKSPHIAFIRPIDRSVFCAFSFVIFVLYRSVAICTDLSDLFESNGEVEISVQK